MSKKKLKKVLSDSGWEVEEITNRLNGVEKTVYYYKNIPARKIPLKGKAVTKMAGYTLISVDIKMILCWLQMIIDEYNKMGVNKLKQTTVHISPKVSREKFDYLKALTVASFSFYGKLFTKADGRKIKLDRNLFNDSAELLPMHNELMTLRHNYVAHSGKENIEFVEVSLMLDSNKKRNTMPLIVRTMNQPDAFNNEFLNDFKNICNFLLKKVESKISLLTDKYYQNLTLENLNMFYEISEKQL